MTTTDRMNRSDQTLSIANDHFVNKTMASVREFTQLEVDRGVFFCAGTILSNDGRQIVLVKGERNGTWYVETFAVQNNTWRSIATNNVHPIMLQQAILRSEDEPRDPSKNEVDRYDPKLDSPRSIMSYSESDGSISIVVCCNQSVHVWKKTEEHTVYKAFILGVDGADFALYDGKLYVSHAKGIYYVCLRDGDMGHVCYFQMAEYLRQTQSCIQAITIRDDGLFALTLVSTYRIGIYTARVLEDFSEERRSMRFDLSEEFNGLYSSVQFSSSRRNMLLALEQFPHHIDGLTLCAPVTIDLAQNEKNKVIGQSSPVFDAQIPEIVGVTDTKLFIYDHDEDCIREFDLATMSVGKMLPPRNIKKPLACAILEHGNRGSMLVIFPSKVVLVGF